MITRKGQLIEALAENGESPDDVVSCFIQRQEGSNEWADQIAPMKRCKFEDLPEREFRDGYGGVEGEPCIAFTKKHVYICIQYDGAEWMTAIPRHPRYVKLIPWPGG